jgi:hypothetical protein
MTKYVVAAVLIAGFAGAAFAEQFYVAFDPTSHRCSMRQSQPPTGMKLMGIYKTEGEAHKAMAGMKECKA